MCGPVAPDIDGEPPVPTIGAYNGLLLEPSRDGFVAPRGHCPNRLKSDIGALVTKRNEWFVERLLKLRADFKADRSVVRKTQRIRCVRLTHAPAPRGTSIDVSRVSDNGTLQFEVALGQRPPKAQGKAKGPDVGADWLAPPGGKRRRGASTLQPPSDAPHHAPLDDAPSHGELLRAMVGDEDAGVLEELDKQDEQVELETTDGDKVPKGDDTRSSDSDSDSDSHSDSDSESEDRRPIAEVPVQEVFPPGPHNLATIKVWAAEIVDRKLLLDGLGFRLNEQWHLLDNENDRVGVISNVQGNMLRADCSKHPHCRCKLKWGRHALCDIEVPLLKWLISGVALAPEAHLEAANELQDEFKKPQR